MEFKNALKQYNYKILDTVNNGNGQSIIIYFKPKEKKEPTKEEPTKEKNEKPHYNNSIPPTIYFGAKHLPNSST